MSFGARSGLLLLAFAAFATASGCNPRAEPEKQKPPAPSPLAAAPPPPAPERSEAETLVEAWRQAQVKLDFDGYAALYADGFRGVKRVGAERRRFDRKGWLADRRSMFKPGLEVRVEHLESTTVDDHLVAVFTQTFSSPSYRDVGRKVLVFGPSSSGRRILREELMTSVVQGGGGSVAELPGFFFARDDAVVLRSEVAESWLTPARRELARAFRAAAESPPETAEEVEETFLTGADVVLPPEVAAFRGKTLYVTRAPLPGTSELPPPCEARVVRVEVANAAKPAFEAVRGVLKYGHIHGSVVLGVFERPCPGALWASETPPKEQFLPEKATGPLRMATLTALRREPEYQKRQVDFESSGGVGLWDDENAFEAYVVQGAAGTGLVHAVASRGLWTESFTSLGVLFELQRDSALRSLGVVMRDSYVTPRLAFDLDADGALELLTSESDMDESWHVLQVKNGKAATGKKVQRSRVYFAPDFVCGG